MNDVTHVVMVDWPESYDAPHMIQCRGLEHANREYRDAIAAFELADITLLKVLASSTAVARRVEASVDQ